MTFINLCLSVPNLDTIVFYIIFVIAIPVMLFSRSDFESLKYYLPALVMLAVILTEAGKPDLFKNLYPVEVISPTAFLSMNIINGLALVGLLTQAIVISLATNNITLGLMSGIVTFAITFPIAQQILPAFIRLSDGLYRKIHDRNSTHINPPSAYNWHKYISGLLLAMLMLSIQYILLVGLTKYILSSGVEVI